MGMFQYIYTKKHFSDFWIPIGKYENSVVKCDWQSDMPGIFCIMPDSLDKFFL